MVQPLDSQDMHSLSAAIGWLGLGSIADAKSELSSISAAQQEHPDVLEVRWIILAEEQNWDEALIIARKLMACAPDRSSGWLHQAYALRRVSHGGLKQAWRALLSAFDKFPKEALISYNLSCYACQMNDLSEAKLLFEKAISIGDKDDIKKRALSDSDLKPLWPLIAKM